MSQAGDAAIIVGFDALNGRWLTPAAAAGSFVPVPPLAGVLLTDSGSLQTDSHDLGNIVCVTPQAVLRPGSVNDIVKMVSYSREHAIKVSVRGQGHTTFGQSLSPGLVIENRWLNQIHSIGPDGAIVDPGLLWHDLIVAAYGHGLTVPAFTGYTQLSIAGTLSVGGVPPANQAGLQIDNVSELDLVTGTGELHTGCSETSDQDLFEAALGGLGQCSLITRAKVDLVPAKSMARTYRIEYFDNATFFSDLRTLINRGELDGVYNIWSPSGPTLSHQINAVAYYNPGSPPDDTHLLRGLSVPPAAAVKLDTTYLEFVFTVDQLYAAYQADGWDTLVKPWFDVWLPDSTVEQYVGEVIQSLTPQDVGPTGFVLLFPQRRSKLTRPFFRVPDTAGGSDWVYLFDILTSSPLPGPNRQFADQMLARNRRLFDRARALGGTCYPIGSLQFSPDDWVAQYGDSWPRFTAIKQRYDPANILTPGPGIFA
jgi:cytokinin dehydrogenase